MLRWQPRCKTNPNPFCFPAILGVGNPSSGAGSVFLLSSRDKDASWLSFIVLTPKTPAGPEHPVGFARFPSASEARLRAGGDMALPPCSLAAGMDSADGCRLLLPLPRDPPTGPAFSDRPVGPGYTQGGWESPLLSYQGKNRLREETCSKIGCRNCDFWESG